MVGLASASSHDGHSLAGLAHLLSSVTAFFTIIQHLRCICVYDSA